MIDILLIPVVGIAVACVARLIRPLAMITPFARLIRRAVAGATIGGVTSFALFGDSTTLQRAVDASDVVWIAAAIVAPLVFFAVHDATEHRSAAMPPLVGETWRWSNHERGTSR